MHMRQFVERRAVDPSFSVQRLLNAPHFSLIYVAVLALASTAKSPTFIPGSPSAQQARTVTDMSFSKALEVLQKGRTAFGGSPALEAVEDISFKFAGTAPESGQSVSPRATLYVRPLSGEGIIDVRNQKSYRKSTTHYLGSGDFTTMVVTTANSGFIMDVTSNAIYPFAPSAVDVNRRVSQRTFAHQWIQLASNHISSLRWLGEQDYDAKKQEIIIIADSDANQTALYFDATTHLLTKTETLGDRLVDGLGSAETVFSDYHSINGVEIPFHITSKYAGSIVQDLTYTDVKLNIHPNAAVFESPGGAEVGPQVGGPPKPLTVTKIGTDVYYLDAVDTGGIFFYSAMFVAFNDYVLVVEAPLGDAYSRAVISKIKEILPGKPIKYLVPTHYHIDHMGGVRAYLAAGTTVVTSPGNVKFIEELTSLTHPLGAARPKYIDPLPIESFEGKRIFSDGEHEVDLYQVGPTPHVDEMIIAYIPREKLVFVSDMFPVNFKGHLRIGDPTTVFFEKKLRELGLPVERIASGHGRIGTIEELRRAAAHYPHLVDAWGYSSKIKGYAARHNAISPRDRFD